MNITSMDYQVNETTNQENQFDFSWLAFCINLTLLAVSFIFQVFFSL